MCGSHAPAGQTLRPDWAAIGPATTGLEGYITQFPPRRAASAGRASAASRRRCWRARARPVSRGHGERRGGRPAWRCWRPWVAAVVAAVEPVADSGCRGPAHQVIGAPAARVLGEAIRDGRSGRAKSAAPCLAPLVCGDGARREAMSGSARAGWEPPRLGRVPRVEDGSRTTACMV